MPAWSHMEEQNIGCKDRNKALGCVTSRDKVVCNKSRPGVAVLP